MSKKPPEPWRNDITMDTRLTAIDGISSISELGVPERVNTVGDAISSIETLNLSPYDESVNTVEHAFSMDYKDFDIDGISSRSDFNISLFLTFIGNTEAYDTDKSKCNAKEESYDDILCSSCGVNTRAISRRRSFSPIAGVNTDKDVRSIVYIEDGKENNKYLFVDKDIKSEYKISTEGVPDGSNYCLVTASYVDQFASLFGYDKIEALARNSNIEHDKPIKIKDKKSTTHGLIAPLISDTDYTEPLSEVEKYNPHLLF